MNALCKICHTFSDPFRLRIPGVELEDMFRNIRTRATVSVDEYLEIGKISEEKNKEI